MVLFRGEPVTTADMRGVPGREPMDIPLVDGARDERLATSGFELIDGRGELFSLPLTGGGVVSSSSFPGGALLEEDFADFCSLAIFAAGTVTAGPPLAVLSSLAGTSSTGLASLAKMTLLSFFVGERLSGGAETLGDGLRGVTGVTTAV